MHELSPEISKLVASMKENPYVLERAKTSVLPLAELSEYGLVCASMIARVAIEHVRLGEMEDPTHNTAIIPFALRLAHIIGEQEDATSNEILEKIFGKEFTQCRALGSLVRRTSRSGYSDEWYPRSITNKDVLEAQQKDQQLISRGAAYLRSREGCKLLQAPITPSAGCPLLRLPKYADKNPFDTLITLFVKFYTDSENDFILGPASSSLEVIRQSQPSNPEGAFFFTWKIPDAPPIHALAE